METNYSIEKINQPMLRMDRRRHHRFIYRYQKIAYLMLLPAFILLTTFVIVPLIMAVIRSFQDYNTGAFIGFYNYDYILSTDLFLQSFRNVLLFTLIITVTMVVTSFAFAHVLKNLNNRIGAMTKVIIYVPFFISGIIAAIIFNMLTNYGGGLITSILISLDMDPVSFTSDGIWPYVAIIVPTLWLGFGYNTLVMYAGLINIPKDYYEAARIDGASPWQCLWSITIPNMKNYFVLIIINLVTVNLQMMEIPYIMTGGGPLNRTLTPVLYLFNSFRDPNRPQNVTIAGAILVMLLISTVNVIVFRFVRSRRSEDA